MKYDLKSMPALQLDIPNNYDFLANRVIQAYMLEEDREVLTQIKKEHQHILGQDVENAIYVQREIIISELENLLASSQKQYTPSFERCQADDLVYLKLVKEQVVHDRKTDSTNINLGRLEHELTKLITSIANISPHEGLDFYLNKHHPIMENNNPAIYFEFK